MINFSEFTLSKFVFDRKQLSQLQAIRIHQTGDKNQVSRPQPQTSALASVIKSAIKSLVA